MELSKEATERVEARVEEAIKCPERVKGLIRRFGENYIEGLRESEVEDEAMAEGFTKHDCYIHEPRDLEGEHIVLDAQAFDIIRSWKDLPAEKKEVIHHIAITAKSFNYRKIESEL
ncbi:MAG: hypothetical protein V5783_00315 [Pontiella sp.]